MSNLINPYRFQAAAPSGDFVSAWKTDNPGTSNNDQITLPLVSSGTYNFVVDWGDGSSDDTITAFDDAAVTHTFIGGAGTFTVTITGQIEGWQFNNGGDVDKIIQISAWGSLEPGTSTNGHFFGCGNLTVTATDTLDTSAMTNMTRMFRDCSSITTLDVSGFDTAACTQMESMFQGCTSLTVIDVTSFNTSLVTTMRGMFNFCTAVVSLDLSGFDTANVTGSGMISMFQSCSNMTTLDITGFDTTSINNMSFMFQSCGSLTALAATNLDTSSVTDMNVMFDGCGDLSTLDVSGFDTTLVTNMTSMFRNCAGLSTLALDQAGWDIGAVTAMSNFCIGVTLGTSNYDAILAAWAAQSPVQSSVTCSFGNSQYTIATAQADRDVLTDAPNSWTLTDGGGV